MSKTIVFIDTEVGVKDHKIYDFGAVREDGSSFHAGSKEQFLDFVGRPDFVCGHNIVHHDLKYINKEANLFRKIRSAAIDTLYLSPLVFPKRPYHALLKDDKLQSDELNNPLNDCLKTKNLFYDIVNEFTRLSSDIQQIYCDLLYNEDEFRGFFEYMSLHPERRNTETLIRTNFSDLLCTNTDFSLWITQYPKELAYALALIGTRDYHSVTPAWLLKNFPQIEHLLKTLCNTPCAEECTYCSYKFNVHQQLQEVFGFKAFRTYDGEALQEKAVQAAVEGKSLLAVFPTGGGKSLTFQLPAIMSGNTVHGLTVVISPLQSLMKDQVDNLESQGITDAVTINGLLDPITRANAFQRVADGSATLLYISPEMLRSKTIEKLLLSRNIVRFVIDEAHCFSAWGHDFRVDYLYIGPFIRGLREKKHGQQAIPVSCFTATAKQKVITDICDYFKKEMDVDLEILASSSTRENLKYAVIHAETEESKYTTLRNLIAGKNCPTIVYVSRTKKTESLAEKLTQDGFPALPFNGKMDANDKVVNQNAFINNEVQVVVATSAFGMGVDKKDVGLVIHYEISDSLENYVQEAGRAGRDPNMNADCYVLFNDADLDKHFILLNQTKLSISEIQQIWKAIKDLTKQRKSVQCSALEIARQAGWDDSVLDIETRVKTAIAALEQAGYVQRGQNVPHVYATGITVKNMDEARKRLAASPLFEETEKQNAIRIIKSLISSRSIAAAQEDDAESRIDYLSDMLGMTKEAVVRAVSLMRQEGVLADSRDMSAYIFKSDTQNKSQSILEKFAKLEQFLIEYLSHSDDSISLKELNEKALNEGIPHSTVKGLKTLLYFLTIRNYIKKVENPESGFLHTILSYESEIIGEKFLKRIELSRFILSELFRKSSEIQSANKDTVAVQFSIKQLAESFSNKSELAFEEKNASVAEVEEALLYLSKIGAVKLEGGFLVVYNGMQIKRVAENKIRYKINDYQLLDNFYKQKIQQIHIVGEYANLMVRDYDAALLFVKDYFQLDYKKFISKYFKEDRAQEISRNISPEKHKKLFGCLSEIQKQIINDKDSKYIVVTAGPGSGKTRVLVHKLASLLQLEDVKHEQLLMLTFSRAAAIEFKKRLIDLIGNAAFFVEIKTFHSYCFDLIGKTGNLDEVENVVRYATEMINNGEVEPGKITKSVLVIDEAQDMDQQEFALVESLMRYNEDMRVIAVGDDDQNIYEFRGSNSKHLQSLVSAYGAKLYEMVENYRSNNLIVSTANKFAEQIQQRMKSNPIVAIRKESGIVQIIRHCGEHLETPVVQHLSMLKPRGSTCILTTTNEEALCVVALLKKHNIRAQLIQSVDGFRFVNLAEIRFFLKLIQKNLTSPVISDENWKNAKYKLFEKYQNSSCLENIRVFIQEFEAVNKQKYFSDLQECVNESQYEDYFARDSSAVVVSTIHKSKGREFDYVFLLLQKLNNRNDETYRKIYVGLTRAKNSLFVHTCIPFLDKVYIPGIEVIYDNINYGWPEELTLQLTHRDVFLGFFKGKKSSLLKLQSGQPLSWKDNSLWCTMDYRDFQTVIFSKAFLGTLNHWKEQGYEIHSAKVLFVVAWKGEEDTEESAVVLPELTLRKC